MRDRGRYDNFWWRWQNWLCLRRRRLGCGGQRRLWLSRFRLDRCGWCWRPWRWRSTWNSWRRHDYRRDRHSWSGYLRPLLRRRLGFFLRDRNRRRSLRHSGRLRIDTRRDCDRWRRMYLRKRSWNRDRLANLRSDRFLGRSRCSSVRSCCRKFALQLTYRSLQLREILSVLLGEFVEPLTKSAVPDIKRNS
jgi:hypothetical protein